MKKKTLALLLILGLMVTALAGCGGGDGDGSSESAEGSAPAADDTLVVGTNPTFAPFEFQDDEGNMEGFDLDLVEAIAEEEGLTVEFKSLEFDSLVGALKTGDIDAIASGMSITPERLQQVSFTNPYMDASLGVFVAEDNQDINGADDLSGKVVAAQSGTTGAEEVQKLADEKKIGEAKILTDYNMCFLELGNGGADALVIDLPVGQNYMKAHEGEVKMVGEPYVADYYGIALAKDNEEVLKKFNDGLKKVIDSGKFEELCKKYDLPVPQNIVDGTAKVEGLNA